MDKNDKKALSETDICDLFITPAIRDAGWDPVRQIRREVTLTTVYSMLGCIASVKAFCVFMIEALSLKATLSEC